MRSCPPMSHCPLGSAAQVGQAKSKASEVRHQEIVTGKDIYRLERLGWIKPLWASVSSSITWDCWSTWNNPHNLLSTDTWFSIKWSINDKHYHLTFSSQPSFLEELFSNYLCFSMSSAFSVPPMLHSLISYTLPFPQPLLPNPLDPIVFSYLNFAPFNTLEHILVS